MSKAEKPLAEIRMSLLVHNWMGDPVSVVQENISDAVVSGIGDTQE